MYVTVMPVNSHFLLTFRPINTTHLQFCQASLFFVIFFPLNVQSCTFVGLIFLPFLFMAYIALRSCLGIMAALWEFHVSWSRCELTFGLNLHLSELQHALIRRVIMSSAE